MCTSAWTMLWAGWCAVHWWNLGQRCRENQGSKLGISSDQHGYRCPQLMTNSDTSGKYALIIATPSNVINIWGGVLSLNQVSWVDRLPTLSGCQGLCTGIFEERASAFQSMRQPKTH